MSKIGIKAVGFANGTRCPHAGQWLKSMDFEAYAGVGFAEFTSNPAEAMAFDDKVAAFKFWQTTSKTHPRRADGKPNRPLTALTAWIEALPL